MKFVVQQLRFPYQLCLSLPIDHLSTVWQDPLQAEWEILLPPGVCMPVPGYKRGNIRNNNSIIKQLYQGEKICSINQVQISNRHKGNTIHHNVIVIDDDDDNNDNNNDDDNDGDHMTIV